MISYKWIILIVSFFTLFMTYGILFSIGLYFKPLETEFNWSRTQISIAISISMIVFGIFQPIVGRLIDKLGPKKVIASSVFILGLSLSLMKYISNLWEFYLVFGVLAGLGFSGSTVLSNSVVVSSWFTNRRGKALGILSAGVNVGQMFILPISMYVILSYGWRFSFSLIGGILLLVILPLILLFIRNNPHTDNKLNSDSQIHGNKQDITYFLKTKPFWLLFLSFYTCGFTAHGIFMHFPIFVAEYGVSEMDAATLIGMVGGISIIGVLVMSFLFDRIGGKNPLASTYLLRSFSVLLLILFIYVNNILILYIFVLLYGFSYFATVPLVSGLTRKIYGQSVMGSLLGLIWFSHALGQSSGPFLAGVLYDYTGSYFSIYVISSFILLIASILSYMIKED